MQWLNAAIACNASAVAIALANAPLWVPRVIASSDHTVSVAPKIVTVGAYKGGVGKTRTAYELAYQLQAPLIDFDYDGGGASGLWGYQHGRYVKAPLLDAFMSEQIPRPLSGGGKRPDLVPTHPNVGSELIHMDPEVVATRV